MMKLILVSLMAFVAVNTGLETDADSKQAQDPAFIAADEKATDLKQDLPVNDFVDANVDKDKELHKRLDALTTKFNARGSPSDENMSLRVKGHKHREEVAKLFNAWFLQQLGVQRSDEGLDGIKRLKKEYPILISIVTALHNLVQVWVDDFFEQTCVLDNLQNDVKVTLATDIFVNCLTGNEAEVQDAVNTLPKVCNTTELCSEKLNEFKKNVTDLSRDARHFLVTAEVQTKDDPATELPPKLKEIHSIIHRIHHYRDHPSTPEQVSPTPPASALRVLRRLQEFSQTVASMLYDYHE